MKSSTWFNRMEGFHSLEACAVHSAFFVDGILHCLVEVVVHSLWKIPILVCQHALHGCWLKALIEFQAVLREWRQLERIDDVIVAKQRNSAECFYYGARYDCYKVVVFFCFATVGKNVYRVLFGEQLRFNSAYSPVIISMNSSKSTVPEPSASISLIMPSKSSFVSLSSRAAKISFSVLVVM